MVFSRNDHIGCNNYPDNKMSKIDSSIDVLITIQFNTDQIQQLQEISPSLRITIHPANKPEDVPSEIWTRCEVLYTDCVFPDHEIAPEIKWIQLHSTGIEKIVSEPLLARPNTKITTLSGAEAQQTAEHAVSMVLALARSLPTFATYQENREWPDTQTEGLIPQELSNSTVGIIGYGSIGRQVARLLHGFGATILATKNDVMHPVDRGYTPDDSGDPEGDIVRRLYPAQAIRSMLKDCDFIVISVPLTLNTKNLINADTLAACKPTAHLIDVSCCGIVNHDALINALNNEKLAGAALDVFPEEPLSNKSPLWTIPNVIITPHIAGQSIHYNERAITLFAKNLSRYIDDLPLYNIADLDKGY